ncbi:hypothetical protein PN456_19210 [Nodularia spumigena CS-586/05]|uniref:hypothetical protein n=1 Tax=Nodularia spumigena TaxID=70799 RepID=UPI00232F0E07|nr:hypothetical protein [Nodularia spumigena]MDB9371049.1 hypothetical protein [Nodularia spumigena CS-586/05]
MKKYDIVFIHGTGVREPGYSKAFSVISQKLKERNENLRLHKCYWGGSLGTTLNAGGRSIPISDTKKAVVTDLSTEEYVLGLWELLYQDPLIELQILAISSGENQAVFGEKPGNNLDNQVRGFTPSSSLQEMLDQAGIEEFFSQAQTIIVNENDYQAAIASAKEPLGEYRMAIARALVAQSSLLVRDKYGEFALSLNGKLRDRIVEQIVAELGGTEKGLFSGVQQSIYGTIRRIINNNLQRKRSGFSEKYSGTLGDILMYQARGQKLRDFVRATIEPLENPTVLIAHSLGGIICVDLLLEQQPPEIALLVTVGSQAPILYELNALVGREYEPNYNLPASFPQWLNIYDPNDFLSYVGEKIFSGKIQDVEIDSKQPFPESHGAYWNNDQVWDAVWQKMVEVANG